MYFNKNSLRLGAYLSALIFISVCLLNPSKVDAIKVTRDKKKVDKPYIEVVTATNDVEYEESSGDDDDSDEQENDDYETVPRATAKTHLNNLIPPYAEVPVDYRRVCIYPNWSILRDSNMAKIYPEDIDPNLCTHIHYAYANIDVRNFQLTPSQYQDFNSGDHGAPLYERIMKLRQVNPNLKILISIGGWFAKSTPFNKILTSVTTRNTFVQNVLNFLRHWQFDGLDIQWEYPGAVEYGATADSKQRYTSLLKYLNKAFKDEYKSSYKQYILSAFVPSDEEHIENGYQVKLVCKYLDYLSVATYDYTGPYDSKTGYNSPLYSRSQEKNSVNSSINFWLQKGCPSKKLLVGIPTYARAFKIVKRLNTPNLVYLGIDSEPYVSPSIYTSEEGILSYYEVCEMMSNNKDTRVYWDDLAEVPFAIVSNTNETLKNGQNVDSNLWISYEDARSARKKAEYVKKMSLGGISVWSLDMDDFKGWFCNLGPYPIIESVKEEFEHKLTLITSSPEHEKQPEPGIVEQTVTQVQTVNQKTKPNEATSAGKLNSVSKSKLTTKAFVNNNNNKNKNKNETTSRELMSSLTTASMNSAESKNESSSSSLDSIARHFKKKFKAIREIKLIACLDKKKCHISNSSTSLKFEIFFWISSLICLFLF